MVMVYYKSTHKDFARVQLLPSIFVGRSSLLISAYLENVFLSNGVPYVEIKHA